MQQQPQPQPQPPAVGIFSYPMHSRSYSGAGIGHGIADHRYRPSQPLPPRRRTLLGYDNYADLMRVQAAAARYANAHYYDGDGGNSTNYNGNGGSDIRMQRGYWWLPGRALADVLRGEVVSMARTDRGCRYLKEKLDEGWTEVRAVILEAVKSDLEGIAQNKCGRILLQKMIMSCCVDEITAFLVALTEDPLSLIAMCIHQEGTLVIEKLIKKLKTNMQQSLLVDALLPHVIALATNENGKHVINACIKWFRYQHGMDFANLIACKSVELAKDKYGCCILQKCLERYGYWHESICRKLIVHAKLLADHPYGNYALQFIINMNMIPGVVAQILYQMKDQIVELSMDKHGSHVIESCIRNSEREDLDMIVNNLTTSRKFLELLQDPIGNYVIQTVIKETRIVKEISYYVLKRRIMSEHSSLESHPFGQIVLASLEQTD
ncbi:hypothetical protein Dimus_002621 [Dionaea muscipula]